MLCTQVQILGKHHRPVYQKLLIVTEPRLAQIICHGTCACAGWPHVGVVVLSLHACHSKSVLVLQAC